MPSLMVARLRDRYRPSRMGIRPRVVSSSSFGCHSVESSWITGGLSGVSSTISVTGWPARAAAEYTNGLKVEPGWRTAWVARLYLESSKSRPPIIARMYPVFASSETSAPWMYGVNGPWSSPEALEDSRYSRYVVRPG